jgi:LemA protein
LELALPTLYIYLIIAPGILIPIYFVVTYNRLVSLRNGVRNGWSDIDVQLTRRHDLVPNLVASVKGYMDHERQTLEAVTQARSQAVAAASAALPVRAAAEAALGGAVSNLFGVTEKYPTLKASENFLLLQEQLTSTESRIAFARQHYNDLVRGYNTAIAEFPRNLIADAGGFVPELMFAAEAGDRANVQVQV